MKRFHPRHWRLRGVATSGQWPCILGRGAFLSTIKTPHRTTFPILIHLCASFSWIKDINQLTDLYSVLTRACRKLWNRRRWGWIGRPPPFLILCLGGRSTELWLSIAELKPSRVNKDERFINLRSEFWMGHANFILEIRNHWRGPRGNRNGVEAVEEGRTFLPSSVRIHPVPLPEIYQEGVIYIIVHSYCDYT